MLKMRGINSPFKDLLESYYRSPACLEEAGAAQGRGLKRGLNGR